jgi:hypothetical protein
VESVMPRACAVQLASYTLPYAVVGVRCNELSSALHASAVDAAVALFGCRWLRFHRVWLTFFPDPPSPLTTNTTPCFLFSLTASAVTSASGGPAARCGPTCRRRCVRF